KLPESERGKRVGHYGLEVKCDHQNSLHSLNLPLVKPERNFLDSLFTRSPSPDYDAFDETKLRRGLVITEQSAREDEKVEELVEFLETEGFHCRYNGASTVAQWYKEYLQGFDLDYVIRETTHEGGPDFQVLREYGQRIECQRAEFNPQKNKE